jgi:hypothetical protein
MVCRVLMGKLQEKGFALFGVTSQYILLNSVKNILHIIPIPQ